MLGDGYADGQEEVDAAIVLSSPCISPLETWRTEKRKKQYMVVSTEGSATYRRSLKSDMKEQTRRRKQSTLVRSPPPAVTSPSSGGTEPASSSPVSTSTSSSSTSVSAVHPASVSHPAAVLSLVRQVVFKVLPLRVVSSHPRAPSRGRCAARTCRRSGGVSRIRVRIAPILSHRQQRQPRRVDRRSVRARTGRDRQRQRLLRVCDVEDSLRLRRRQR